MDEDRPLRPELAGQGAVDELARIGGAHLEQDPQLKLLQRPALEGAHEIRERIAPHERMDADGRAVAEDRREVVGGPGLLVAAAEGEAEVAVGLAQLPEPGQIADDDEHRFAVDHLMIEAALHLGGQIGHRIGDAEPADTEKIVGKAGGELREEEIGLFVGDRRLEEHEAGIVAELPTRERIVGRRQPDDRHCQEAHRQILALADDEEIRSSLPAEDRRRRILDGDRVAEPGDRGDEIAASGRALGEELAEEDIAVGVGRLVAVEHDPWHRLDVGAPVGKAAQLAEIPLAAGVVEPHDLEGIVAGHHAVGVVVDRLAGAGEEPGGRIVFREDQAAIGLVALQRDAHRHLPHCRPGKAVGAAERLRAKEDVHPEGTALTDEAIEDQRRILGELVVLDKKLLELVDDEEDARHRLGTASAAEAGEILDGQIPEQVAAPLQLAVELLEHREAELTLALDGDDARVRQLVVVVDLELDPLLEVDEIKLNFIRAVGEREIRDQRVHHRRLARAGLAGDEDMLARSLAELHVLHLLGAGGAERHVDAAGRAPRPPPIFCGGDAVEGDLDALGSLRRLADPLDDVCEHLIRGRLLHAERPLRELGVLPGEGAVFQNERGRVLLDVGEAEVGRQCLLRVDRHDRVDAAPRPAGGDARQPTGAGLGEVGREVADDDEAVGLGDLGIGVVSADRGVFVAEVFLDHQFHLLGDVGQALLDLLRLGPDSAGDEELVVIGQMHEAGEVLSQSERIDDREPGLAGGGAGSDSQGERLEEGAGDFLLVGRRLHKHRALGGEGDGRRLGPRRRAEGIEIALGRDAAGDLRHREGNRPESQPRGIMGGKGGRSIGEGVPGREAGRVDPVGLFPDCGRLAADAGPVLRHRARPLGMVFGGGRQAGVALHLAAADVLDEAGLEDGDAGRILLLGLFPPALDLRADRRRGGLVFPLELRRLGIALCGEVGERLLRPRFQLDEILLRLRLHLLRLQAAADLEPFGRGAEEPLAAEDVALDGRPQLEGFLGRFFFEAAEDRL